MIELNGIRSRFIGLPEGERVSRFLVEFEIANYRDVLMMEEGDLPAAKVRRMRPSGVVDSGATSLVLPQALAKKLGLKQVGKVRVRYADGRRAIRPKVGPVQVKILDREGIFEAVVEPKRKTALIGALVLESFDLIVDCTNERLFPRDPEMVFAEIE
jgi:predicted aspartyl protease